MKQGADANSIQLHGAHDVDQAWIARLRQPHSPEECAAAGTQTCPAFEVRALGRARARGRTSSARHTCAHLRAACLLSTCGTPRAALHPAACQHCAPRRLAARHRGCDASRQAPLVVPRMLLELPPSLLEMMVNQPGQPIQLMLNEVTKHGFDGLVRRQSPCGAGSGHWQGHDAGGVRDGAATACAERPAGDETSEVPEPACAASTSHARGPLPALDAHPSCMAAGRVCAASCLTCSRCACAQVLEGWLQWAAVHLMEHHKFRQAALTFVRQLADVLHANGKVCVTGGAGFARVCVCLTVPSRRHSHRLASTRQLRWRSHACMHSPPPPPGRTHHTGAAARRAAGCAGAARAARR
jgi:hypothetical protein